MLSLFSDGVDMVGGGEEWGYWKTGCLELSSADGHGFGRELQGGFAVVRRRKLASEFLGKQMDFLRGTCTYPENNPSAAPPLAMQFKYSIWQLEAGLQRLCAASKVLNYFPEDLTGEGCFSCHLLGWLDT